MIFVKSFTQARFQQIWKFTPITRKPRHVLPPKTPYKSKQMCDSPTVLLRYALSLLYNIKLIKNYTKIFEITQDMSSPAEILPNIEIIYTSAACDACDKCHVWRQVTLNERACREVIPLYFRPFLYLLPSRTTWCVGHSEWEGIHCHLIEAKLRENKSMGPGG